MSNLGAIGRVFVAALGLLSVGAAKCGAEETLRLGITTPRHVVDTETLVSLEESANLEVGLAIIGVSHTVQQIGIYHRGLRRFILMPTSDYLFRGLASDTVPGLLGRARMSSHGMPYERKADGSVAISFESRFREPGIYAIRAHWSVRKRRSPSENLGSAPLILFVAPSVIYESEAEKRYVGRYEMGTLAFQRHLEKYFDTYRDYEEFKYFIFPEMKIQVTASSQ
ncbi:MAG: hypothetical protein KDA71_14560 [Planctomycetales bacterium]|nr:hypothetical protein [Planctomycetales bacterium]